MRKVLLLLVLFFSFMADSNADYQGRLLFRTDISVTPAPYQWFDNYAQACDVSLDAYTSAANATYTARLNQISPTQCSIARNGTTKILSISIDKDCNGTRTTWTGNANGTAGILTCTGTPSCPTGQTFIGGACVDNCNQYKGQTVQVALNCATADTSVVCMPNNCVANLGSSVTIFDKTKQCRYGTADGVYSGVTCNGQTPSTALSNPTNANPPPTDSPEAKCVKNGQSFGTVNGQVVCVSAGTAGSPPINQTSTTTTQTDTRDANGNLKSTAATTQTAAVSSDGQQVVKTTQTKNPDGTVTTETKQQDFNQFCVENPNNKICKSSETESKFTGTCASSFACEGDAVQCAMALKQHQVYCEAVADDPTRTAFTDDVAATTGQKLSDWIPQSIVNIPTDLTGQKLLSSACLADMTFPIVGQSITLPLSKLCPALEFCGTVVKLFSYLFSAIIIFGRRGS